jgi:hypothetical protein
MTHSNSPDDRDAEVTRRLHDLDAYLDALFTADRDDPQRVAAFRAEFARRLDPTGPAQAASPASPTADQPHAAAAASNRSTTADPRFSAGMHDVRERLVARSRATTASTHPSNRVHPTRSARTRQHVKCAQPAHPRRHLHAPSLELAAVSLAPLAFGLLGAGLLIWHPGGGWIWLGIPIGLCGGLASMVLRSILSANEMPRNKAKIHMPRLIMGASFGASAIVAVVVKLIQAL